MAIRRGVWVDVDVRGALRALRGIPREASQQLRKASVAIVNAEIPRIAAQAAFAGRNARAAARSLRARSDRVPAIAVGGRRRVTNSRNGSAGSIFFGSDAGSVQWEQFDPPTDSQWFWAQLAFDASEIMATWGKAYDQAVHSWAGRD